MNARAYTPAKGPSRIVAAALSLALQFGVIAVLIYGLAPKFVARAVETFSTVALDPPPTPPPPRPPPPPPAQARAAAGKAAPANSRAKAAEVLVAPQPIPLPVPIRAALVPAIGSADHSGAAPLPGPGSGAGGAGNGTGSGNSGDGSGAGDGTGDGDGGDDAEWTGGRITDRDVPKSARDTLRQGGTTSALVAISASGRATDCRVTRSSGSGELDATACRLILQRFRFRPATDRAGNRIAGQIAYDQEWVRSGEWDGRGDPPPD